MANKPILMRIPDRQREHWTAAATRAGQSLIDWLKDVADVAATEPPAPTRTETPSRPLTSVRAPRVQTSPAPKASGLTDGAHSVRLAYRADQPPEPDTRKTPRCSKHKKLEADAYSECDAQCRAEWGKTGVAELADAAEARA